MPRLSPRITPEVAALVDGAFLALWKAWRLYCGLPLPPAPTEAPEARQVRPPTPQPTKDASPQPSHQLEHHPLALWSEKRVREVTSLSHNEIHRRRIAGTFPRPEPIGGRRVAYRASEVMDWLKNPTGWKVSQQDGPE